MTYDIAGGRHPDVRYRRNFDIENFDIDSEVKLRGKVPDASALLRQSRSAKFGQLLDCGARGLAGFDDSIFCTLRAAVRQPASAGCRAAARGTAPLAVTPSRTFDLRLGVLTTVARLRLGQRASSSTEFKHLKMKLRRFSFPA